MPMIYILHSQTSKQFWHLLSNWVILSFVLSIFASLWLLKFGLKKWTKNAFFIQYLLRIHWSKDFLESFDLRSSTYTLFGKEIKRKEVRYLSKENLFSLVLESLQSIYSAKFCHWLLGRPKNIISPHVTPQFHPLGSHLNSTSLKSVLSNLAFKSTLSLLHPASFSGFWQFDGKISTMC